MRNDHLFSSGDEEADEVDGFEAAKGFRIFARGREPRNVDLSRVDDRDRHSFILKGITNFMEWVGRDPIETGELLIMCAGELREPSEQRSMFRMSALISGSIWNPLTCDCTVNYFDNLSDTFCAVLPLPVYVKIKVRPDRVASSFKAFCSRTLDEFVISLTGAGVKNLSLLQCEYSIPFEREQPLMWSCITAVKDVGPLYEMGQSEPLLTEELRCRRQAERERKRVQKLDNVDPFAVVAYSTHTDSYTLALRHVTSRESRHCLISIRLLDQYFATTY